MSLIVLQVLWFYIDVVLTFSTRMSYNGHHGDFRRIIMTLLTLDFDRRWHKCKTNRTWLRDQYPPSSYFMYAFNTLRPRQNGRHFADDISKCIFLNENVWIPIKISMKFVPKGPINNIPALVQIMAWRRPGDKPLSEPMMVILTTHICVTRPQWVKYSVLSDLRNSSPMRV